MNGKLTPGKWQWQTKEDEGNSAGKLHDGIDYPAAKGTAVLAVADGTVAKFESGVLKESTIVNKKPFWLQGDGKGNYVQLNHGVGKNGKNIYTFYEHLSKVNVKKVGDPVKKGDVIGYVGLTGDTFGYHLHYQVNEGNTPVDPKNLDSLLGGKSIKVGLTSSQVAAGNSLMQAVMGAYSGDTNSIQALLNATGVSGTMSKYGVSSGSTSPANQYANAGDTGAAGGGGGTTGGTITNNVGGITVNIKDASPESAQKFAQIVQDYLNNQTLTSNLGSY